MTNEELKFELVYITESPPEEDGGFNSRVVAVAEAALLVLDERDAAYAVMEKWGMWQWFIPGSDWDLLGKETRELLAKRKA